MFILTFISFSLLSCSPSTDSLYEKAYGLEEKRNWKEAIEVYTKISKKHPSFQDAIFRKGYCFLEDSNYSNALECFDKVLIKKGVGNKDEFVLEMNPESPFATEKDRHQVALNEVYYQMAIVNYKIDSLKTSYVLFKHCSNSNFSVGNCYIWMGLIWSRFDSLNKACDFFHKAKDLNEPEADRFINEYCLNETK